MSTAIDTRERSQSRLRLWLAISVALAALVLAVGWRLVGGREAPAAAGAAAASGSPGDMYGIAPNVYAWLTERLVATLESATPADHAHHGHDIAGAEASPGAKPVVLCTAEPFGIEPAGATMPGAVTTVYAHHLCAVVEKGRPWDFAVKMAGPLVAHNTNPMDIKVVESGRGYDERVKQMIPAEYQARALIDFGDGSLVKRLRQRYEDAAK
ncbi:hypothetical protein [Rhizomonospora bruguierae]|uniref:hypothetical protein n=1 Tax=Rhizomonospora bruguierae TaxID=1581705 RepID=UPI001BCBC052|nr:hypothetical protein [Micromonospora sp. NBRC 107566]